MGDNGDDLLVGNDGRDLLIGDDGADRIVGSAGDDILIAGRTLYDDNDEALCTIMAEWTSDAGYQTRVANIMAGLPLGMTTVKLDDTTVSSDNNTDLLTGASGQDWFFLNLDNDGGPKDRVTDRSASEFANDIDFITLS